MGLKPSAGKPSAGIQMSLVALGCVPAAWISLSCSPFPQGLILQPTQGRDLPMALPHMKHPGLLCQIIRKSGKTQHTNDPVPFLLDQARAMLVGPAKRVKPFGSAQSFGVASPGPSLMSRGSCSSRVA